MRLTPVEIQHQPLKRRWRGYDQGDVDKLLEDAAASYEQVWRERDELDARVTELDARVTELEAQLNSFHDSEHLLSESLVTVHRFADELRNEAKKEAERLARKAQADRQRKKAAAERELEDLRADIERLRSLERDLRSSVRTLLHEALKLIEDENPDDEARKDEALAEILTAEPESTGAEDRHG